MQQRMLERVIYPWHSKIFNMRFSQTKLCFEKMLGVLKLWSKEVGSPMDYNQRPAECSRGVWDIMGY